MKKYLEYLPEFLRDIEEFDQIGKAENLIIEDEENIFKEIENAQWTETSGEAGLLRREKILGIKSYSTDSDDERRAVISARWNSYYPYTYYSMINWLESVYGKKNFTVSIDYEAYRVSIELGLSIKYLLEEIFGEARRMIPANMKLTVSLKYTRHRDINVVYGDLRELTHKLVRETSFDKSLNG